LLRFSHRLFWSFSQNSLSALIDRQRRSGITLLDLTVSNPTEAFTGYPSALIAAALAQVADLRYRPEPFGDLHAREAISATYASHGPSISPARLALTASTSEAYAVLFKLLCDPGDEILVPVPSYPLFEYLAALESVRIVHYRLEYDGSWYIDTDSLRRRIGQRTRAIVIVNPNNPTGSFLKRAEWAIVSSFGIPVISDEVFTAYPLAPASDFISLAATDSPVLTFSLNGLSKSAGMPQMKLAWIAIDGPEAAAASERLELILDTYLSANTPVQRALPRLLEIGAGLRASILDRVRRNLQAANRILGGSNCHALHAEGGWSAIVQLPRIRSEEAWITSLVRERQTIFQPGYFFDMPSEAYAVASLITPPEIFAEGLSRLRQAAS
jgi:alanine-synthesizing transaminase